MKHNRNYDHPPVYAESDAAAAVRHDLSGWVSRSGHYYGHAERAARIDGSDVHICTNNPAHGAVENRGYCSVCADEREEESWDRLKKMTPAQFALVNEFFLYNGDEYFGDLDEVESYMDANDLEEIRLVDAVPGYMQLNNSEQFADITPDEDWGGTCDEKLEAADEIIAEANKKLRALGPLSYGPGKLGYLYRIGDEIAH